MHTAEADYNRQLARIQAKALGKLEDLLANAGSFSEATRVLSLIARLKPQREPEAPPPEAATSPQQERGGSARSAACLPERAPVIAGALTVLPTHPDTVLPAAPMTSLSATAQLLARAGQSLLTQQIPAPLRAQATGPHPPAG